MSFNIYGTPSITDIRVGYINPSLGYVYGITVDEANIYAKNNPGTVFIFKDGNNNIRYLNINEVNQLTINDLYSNQNSCGGIQDYKECGPPTIQFFGGGGIGAVGNPVVGKDGSLLAVDLVSGGYGYQYPPIVAAKDACQLGNGAVLTSVLGETVSKVEVYDGKEDFEEYILPEELESEYGIVYGSNGEELGPWEPDLYGIIGEDPIKEEIEAFQKALETPFWTTRKLQPDRVSTLGINYATQSSYPVTHPTWGEFMNTYGISPVKPSDTVGSDEAGKVFTIEWDYDFPITGEYVFRGTSDDVGQVYIDNDLVGNLQSFNQNPTPIQKTIIEGSHTIRIDLLNNQFTEITPQNTTTTTTSKSKLKAKFIQKGTSYYLNVEGTGTGEINFVMEVNDKLTIAGLAAKEIWIPSDKGKIKFIRTELTLEDGNYIPGLSIPTEETIKKSGTFSGGNLYGPIEIIGADPAALGPKPIPKEGANAINLRDAEGEDNNIKIIIEKVDEDKNKTSDGGIVVSETISPKSWSQNPIGVSMIIDAPVPPIPKENIPPVEGECPPSPIWTTRYPNSSQQWYPVRNDIWADFFNRYAISPVPPLNTPGSDGSGIVHKNSWTIDIPYRGYYNFQVQRDNTARIYVDGKLAFDVRTSGDDLWVKQGLENKVKTQKVFIERGIHTISIELENTPQNNNSIINAKIFSTQDWRVPAASSTSKSKLKAKFIQKGTSYYLNVEGTGKGEINFVMEVNDALYIAGLAAKEVWIPSDRGDIKFIRDELSLAEGGAIPGLITPTEETIRKSGTFSGGNLYGPIQFIGVDPAALGPKPIPKEGANAINLRDAEGEDNNIKIIIEKVDDVKTPITSTETPQLNSVGGIIYEGPSIFGYTYKGWGNYMNQYSVSPTPVDEIGLKTLIWKNVNFFEDGQYKIKFGADNNATLKIGGRDIITTSDFTGEPIEYVVNFTKGTYDIVIELENIENQSGNSDNPSGVALYISKDVFFSESNKTSWVDNPMGISAILIPPPCSKQIGGKGVVTDVIVEDPGNGYLPPRETGPSYPVNLILQDVVVVNQGINYRCGEDEIQITPNNGVVLEYECDSFGRINSVNVLNPGSGFDVYPNITIPSETGVNAKFIPVFKVVRDPIPGFGDDPDTILPETLIQVTDLVGLKQTGYVDGRAYYGAVYYDQGIRYAGYYKTTGTPVRVYSTLQESITANVTTPASAIQRSGTDVTSNDPTLNIPRTPRSTSEQ